MMMKPHLFVIFFFFNDTATTEIYTLSLHDALPISHHAAGFFRHQLFFGASEHFLPAEAVGDDERSEEHTSELQSRSDLVCRLLLEKKKDRHADVHTDHHKSNAI